MSLFDHHLNQIYDSIEAHLVFFNLVTENALQDTKLFETTIHCFTTFCWGQASQLHDDESMNLL